MTTFRQFLTKLAQVTGMVILAASLFAFANSPVSLAQDIIPGFQGGIDGGAKAARGSDQPTDLFGDGGIFKQITNILLFIVGVLSVIMLIVGGLRYVISGGKQQAVSDAKNTILYAIVGLIVSLLAYAVINFVIGAFTSTYSSGGGGIDA